MGKDIDNSVIVVGNTSENGMRVFWQQSSSFDTQFQTLGENFDVDIGLYFHDLTS